MTTIKREGTVIHATLREPDLIIAFLGELKSIADDPTRSLDDRDRAFKAYYRIRNPIQWNVALSGDRNRSVRPTNGPLDDAHHAWWDAAFANVEGVEMIHDTLSVLMDSLDSFAPPGMQFGAHPGDGSDFGWWPVEEDEL